MEEMNIFIQAVGSIGFPAVVCGYTLYVVNTSLKESTEVMNEVKTMLKTVLDMKRDEER